MKKKTHFREGLRSYLEYSGIEKNLGKNCVFCMFCKKNDNKQICLDNSFSNLLTAFCRVRKYVTDVIFGSS